MSNQLPPILSLYSPSTGVYIARVDDSPLAKQLTPILLSSLQGAKSLTLVTPSEMKVFALDSAPSLHDEPSQQAAEVAIAQTTYDGAAPPPADIAEEYIKQLEATEATNATEPLPPEEASPEPPMRRRKRERPQPESEIGAVKQCGRCYGTGSTEGGGVCPVCRGSKVIKPWGLRRR